MLIGRSVMVPLYIPAEAAAGDSNYTYFTPV